MVWGTNLRNGNEYAWVLDINPISRVVKYPWAKEPFTFTADLVVRFADGKKAECKFEDVSFVDSMVFDINLKTKWSVNLLLGNTPFKVAMDNGYFGSYSLIEYKGKKAVVYCDDRDAIVKQITTFYDDITCLSWDGDYRWNHDKPCVVKSDGVYNILAPHTNKLLCKEWLKEIEPKWKNSKELGYYLNGINENGDNVVITANGTIRNAELSTSANINNVLSAVKLLTLQEIIDCWIKKGFPCAHICGLEYKGARCGIISMESALEYIKTHNRFNGSFNSAEWRVLDGAVTLLFRDYCNSDYD